MSTRKSALLAALAAIGSATVHAGDVQLAWQTPGYVMDEVVVTARAPLDGQARAWTQPGYVMEEVVVTAPDVSASLVALTDDSIEEEQTLR